MSIVLLVCVKKFITITTAYAGIMSRSSISDYEFLITTDCLLVIFCIKYKATYSYLAFTKNLLNLFMQTYMHTIENQAAV